jgi:hypothetical protein
MKITDIVNLCHSFNVRDQFQTHAKQHVILQFCKCSYLCFYVTDWKTKGYEVNVSTQSRTGTHKIKFNFCMQLCAEITLGYGSQGLFDVNKIV